MLTTAPLIAWGAADDISTYSAVGSATVASGNTDPFGGTSAYRIADVGATAEARFKALTGLPDGTSWFAVCVRGDTATTSGLEVWDNTASAVRHRLKFTWSGGVPAIATTVSGSGTIMAPISMGSLWHLVLFSATSIVGANANRLYLYPADPSIAADTGRAFFYVRNLVVLDLFDEAMSWEEDREGTTYETGPSGFRDTALVGTDQLLEGKIRNIPANPTNYPDTKSGWYGENESTGVNCGIKAMLKAGRNAQLLRWVPDRTACTTYQDAYLDAPIKEKPETEDSALRRVGLRLRGSSVFTGV